MTCLEERARESVAAILMSSSIGRSQVGWIGGLQIPQTWYFGVWNTENMSIEAKYYSSARQAATRPCYTPLLLPVPLPRTRLLKCLPS
jgi:hypothetical protein